ncbi:hypothetical protein KIW84_062394 [Lathyrus oleraceus]|uniref:Uncharacterized protein n=1 Tax=Pisum sativum TaxID=3888 RepID=A0A9D4W8A8_PEA|nr:hypothetical protein KIW84_062394 [Pisum sativum]
MVTEEGPEKVNMFDLDACKGEARHVLDDDFKVLQLNDNLVWSLKIRSKLPIKLKSMLNKCLLANTNIFAISPLEMPNIDPIVAFHQLNVNPSAWYVSQQRRRQSLEKSEATTSNVKVLLDTNFIFKTEEYERNISEDDKQGLSKINRRYTGGMHGQHDRKVQSRRDS